MRWLHPISAAYHLTWIFILAILLLFHFDPQTGFTSLIRFGESWEGRRVPELQAVHYAVIRKQAGYDGQFYAQIAVHPQLTDSELAGAMDSVHYRARRILLPMLAYILGGGQPALVTHLFSCFNVIGWLFLAWLLSGWLPPVSWQNFGRWFFCVASAGALNSLRSSLTDLPSLCLLLLALRMWELRRPRLTALILALTGLARETMLLGGLFVWEGKERWRQALLVGLVALLPILGWTLYLHHLFPSGDHSSDNFSWPFLEMVRATWQSLLSFPKQINDNGRYLFEILAVVGFGVQIFILLQVAQPSNPFWRMALPFLLLFPILGQPVWLGYWAVCRAVLPMTVAFNLLLPANRWFWPLLLAASLPTTLHAIFRLAF